MRSEKKIKEQLEISRKLWKSGYQSPTNNAWIAVLEWVLRSPRKPKKAKKGAAR